MRSSINDNLRQDLKLFWSESRTSNISYIQSPSGLDCHFHLLQTFPKGFQNLFCSWIAEFSMNIKYFCWQCRLYKAHPDVVTQNFAHFGRISVNSTNLFCKLKNSTYHNHMQKYAWDFLFSQQLPWNNLYFKNKCRDILFGDEFSWSIQ